jgi:hypothetical protein
MAFRIACTKMPVENYSVLDLTWIPHGYIGLSRDDCVTAHDKEQVVNGHIPPVGEKCIGNVIQLIVACAVFFSIGVRGGIRMECLRQTAHSRQSQRPSCRLGRKTDAAAFSFVLAKKRRQQQQRWMMMMSSMMMVMMMR